MPSGAYAALLLDLDGTLIGRDERISPRVSAAVGQASKLLSVSIFTGREPADAIRFARELGLTSAQVSDNGALMLDPTTGANLWSVSLPPEVARQVIAGFRSLGLSFIATHNDGTSTQADATVPADVRRVSALDMDEETADGLVCRLKTRAELHVVKVSLPYNGLWAVDVTRRGVDKAEAARRLAERLGIGTAQMIAVGDSYNDLPMLQVCGLGIAMGQGPEELKAVADHVAPSVDEDGLATAIESFVLPRLAP